MSPINVDGFLKTVAIDNDLLFDPIVLETLERTQGLFG